MTPKQIKIIKKIYIALAMFYMVILEIIRTLSMQEQHLKLFGQAFPLFVYCFFSGFVVGNFDQAIRYGYFHLFAERFGYIDKDVDERYRSIVLYMWISIIITGPVYAIIYLYMHRFIFREYTIERIVEIVAKSNIPVLSELFARESFSAGSVVFGLMFFAIASVAIYVAFTVLRKPFELPKLDLTTGSKILTYSILFYSLCMLPFVPEFFTCMVITLIASFITWIGPFIIKIRESFNEIKRLISEIRNGFVYFTDESAILHRVMLLQPICGVCLIGTFLLAQWLSGNVYVQIVLISSFGIVLSIILDILIQYHKSRINQILSKNRNKTNTKGKRKCR